MIQVQEIYDSFKRYKQDVSDVDVNSLFLEWVRFTTRFIYKKVRKVDPSRFTKTQSYSVVVPPQKEALPSDFRDLNQTTCGLFRYETRDKDIVSFDETGDTDITFTDTGGTSEYNSAIRVKGGSSRGYRKDGAATMNLSFATALNLNSFGDSGADSPSNDFISLWIWIGNTLPTSVTVEFSTNSNGSDADVNEFETVKTDLIAGWNRLKVAKSAFTITGTPDWANLAYLRLTHTGGDATTDIFYDKMELVESEVNGKDERDSKIALTGFGSRDEGYYLDLDKKIVFTHGNERPNADYIMRYMPKPPKPSSITKLTDYITSDGTINGQEIVEDEDLEYMVKAIDVLYEQWDRDPQMEAAADQRFVRALGEILDGFNRQPQISTINTPANDY